MFETQVGTVQWFESEATIIPTPSWAAVRPAASAWSILPSAAARPRRGSTEEDGMSRRKHWAADQECPHCGLSVPCTAEGEFKAHGRRALEAGRADAECAAGMGQPMTPHIIEPGLRTPGPIVIEEVPIHRMGRRANP